MLLVRVSVVRCRKVLVRHGKLGGWDRWRLGIEPPSMIAIIDWFFRYRYYINRSRWINQNFTTIQLLEHSPFIGKDGEVWIFSAFFATNARQVTLPLPTLPPIEERAPASLDQGTIREFCKKSRNRKAGDFWRQLIFFQEFRQDCCRFLMPSLKLTKIDAWKRRFLLGTIIFRGYVSFREGNFFILKARIQLQTADVLLDQELPLPTVPPEENAPAAVDQVPLFTIVLKKACRKLTCWGMILIYFDHSCLQGCRTFGFNDCICRIFWTLRNCPFPLWRQNQQLWIRCRFGICLFSYWQWYFLTSPWRSHGRYNSEHVLMVRGVYTNDSFAFSHAHIYFWNIYCVHPPVVLVQVLNCTATWSVSLSYFAVKGCMYLSLSLSLSLYICNTHHIDIFPRWLVSASWLC